MLPRTLPAVMNPTLQVDPKRGRTLAPLTQGPVLPLAATLDPIHQQRITVMKRHQTMSPASSLKAENLQPSEWIIVWD